MVMYDIYNSETIEKLINKIQKVHNKTNLNENQLWVSFRYCYQWYLSDELAVHYAINSILTLTH